MKNTLLFVSFALMQPNISGAQEVKLLSIEKTDGRIIDAEIIGLSENAVVVRRADKEIFEIPLSGITAASTTKIRAHQSAAGKIAGSQKESAAPIWAQVIKDRRLWGESPPWKEIEHTGSAILGILKQTGGVHDQIQVGSGIAKARVTPSDISQLYGPGVVSVLPQKDGKLIYYRYGPIAFGVPENEVVVSWISAPSEFFTTGFITQAEDASGRITADASDLPALIGTWTYSNQFLARTSPKWVIDGEGKLKNDPNTYQIIGNRAVIGGVTSFTIDVVRPGLINLKYPSGLEYKLVKGESLPLDPFKGIWKDENELLFLTIGQKDPERCDGKFKAGGATSSGGSLVRVPEGILADVAGYRFLLTPLGDGTMKAEAHEGIAANLPKNHQTFVLHKEQ